MVEIKNKEDLEKALKEKAKEDLNKEIAKKSIPEISRDEEIGFHKGAINTLSAERNELIKMVQTVEYIMQAHLKRLEELGVKIN